MSRPEGAPGLAAGPTCPACGACEVVAVAVDSTHGLLGNADFEGEVSYACRACRRLSWASSFGARLFDHVPAREVPDAAAIVPLPSCPRCGCGWVSGQAADRYRCWLCSAEFVRPARPSGSAGPELGREVLQPGLRELLVQLRMEASDAEIARAASTLATRLDLWFALERGERDRLCRYGGADGARVGAAIDAAWKVRAREHRPQPCPACLRATVYAAEWLPPDDPEWLTRRAQQPGSWRTVCDSCGRHDELDETPWYDGS